MSCDNSLAIMVGKNGGLCDRGICALMHEVVVTRAAHTRAASRCFLPKFGSQIGTSFRARQRCVCEPMQSYRSVESATDNTESTCKNSTFNQKRLYGKVPNRLITTLHMHHRNNSSL